MQRPLIIAVCCSLSLSATSLLATEPVVAGPAGHVESFNCLATGYELIRQGQVLPAEDLKVFTRLYAHDQVKLKKRTCEMTLRVNEINIIHLSAERLSYTVTDSGTPPNLPQNFWKLLVESVNYLLYGEGETPSRTVILRGPEGESPQALVIPSLQTEGAHLVAGDRTLHLLWEGGQPPYRVRLYQGESKTPVLEQTKVTTRQVQLGQYSFQEGQTYQIRIESLPASDCHIKLEESQCRATGTFTVVAPAQLPAMPAELGQSTLTEAQKQTLFATWLLHPDRQNRVTWGLEAYQWVATGEDEFSKWVRAHGKW